MMENWVLLLQIHHINYMWSVHPLSLETTFIGGNLSIGGTFTGRLALGQTLEANIFTTSGISTFNNVNLMFQVPLGFGSGYTKLLMWIFNRQQQSFGSVGVGTTNPDR